MLFHCFVKLPQFVCFFFHCQLEVVGFHLRTGGELADSAAAHDPEPRIPCHLVHAAALLPRPSDARGIGLVPQPDQVPGHVSLGQQRPAPETSK